MGNCPEEEEDDDAQVGFSESPPTHFYPATFSSKLALAISPALLGHQALKPKQLHR